MPYCYYHCYYQRWGGMQIWTLHIHLLCILIIPSRESSIYKG